MKRLTFLGRVRFNFFAVIFDALSKFSRTSPLTGGVCPDRIGILPYQVERSKRRILKATAAVVLVVFATTQMSWGQEYQATEYLGYQPVKQANAPEAVVKVESKPTPETETTTQQFLQQTLTLSPAIPEKKDEEKPIAAKQEQRTELRRSESSSVQTYEYERYDFKDAADLLRPEYASAVIVKDLKAEDLKELVNLSFETGILLLHGEIVLFTSGSEDEVGVLPAVKDLIHKASFISHTHPGVSSKEGPSGQDLNEATSNFPEYVITHQGVYAYNHEAVLNPGNPYSYDWYMAMLNQALEASREDKRETAARQDLNLFIAEQDRYNLAPESERETLRMGGTLSYTPGLTASNVTTLPGGPYPYFTPGSTQATTLSYNATTNQFLLGYSVPGTNDVSGLTLSFDNASTAAVETQNIISFTNLFFGLKGPNSSVKLEFVDINGRKDTFTLTNISNSTERFWKVPVSAISSTLDKTKIKCINFIVTQANTTSTTRTATLYIRTKGLNTSVPAQPAVTSTVPASTNQTALTLSGTKEANTAVLINGIQVVSLDSFTTWSATVNLATEGNNTFNIQAKNSIGKLSTTNSVTILRDTTLPTGSVNINSGALYASSQTVTLNLSASDSGSGMDKMSFSSDNTTWTTPEVYATSKSFTLSSGDGSKTVFVKFYDKVGNIGAVYSKSIILDTLAPTGTVTVNNGAQYITQTAVTLNLSAMDAGSGLDKMNFSSDNVTWPAAEIYAATKSWTFSSGDGNKTVYVKFLDKSGKWSSPAAVTVLLDTIPPTGSTNINSSATLTNKRDVTLNLSASDSGSGVGTMSFSTDNINWTTPEAYATSKTFALPTGDGTKTVYVKFYDKAGKVSQVYSKSITLDTNAPQIQLLSATSVSNSVYTLRYKVDGVEKIEAWILGRGENHFMLFAEDAAENRARLEAKVTLTPNTFPVPNLPATDPVDTFTQTLDSGLAIHYGDGKLTLVEKPGEYKVHVPELDNNGNLTGGYFEFQDGTKSFFQAGKLIFTEDLQGTRTYYKDDGTIDVLVSKDGVKTVLAYRKDASGNTVEILGSTTDAASYYDKDGKLTRIFLNDGINILFSAGKINKTRDAQGNMFHYTASTVTGGTLVTRVEASTDFPRTLLYDSTGALVKATREDGTEYSFQGGLITKVKNPDGTESAYTYDIKDSLLNLISLQRGDTTITYDSKGVLSKIQTKDGVLLADGQTLKTFNFTDGGQLTDFTLDSKGNIVKGTLIDKDGNRLYYEQGTLVSSTSPDGATRKFSSTGKMLEMTTPDGRTYRYADSIDAQGNTITTATLVSYKDVQGNLFSFLNGAVNQIELQDLSAPVSNTKPSPVTQNADGSYSVKTDTAQIRNLVFDSNGKVKSGHFIFADGREYFVTDYKLTSFVDRQGKRFNFEDARLDPQSPATPPLTQEEQTLRTSLITQNLDFFKDDVGIDTASGLPLDFLNIMEMPNPDPSAPPSTYPMPVGYTQPTAIGFYVEILAQIALGQITTPNISKADALTRLEKAISSLETIQTSLGYKGLIPFVNLKQGMTIMIPPTDPMPPQMINAPYSPYSSTIGFGDNANLSQSIAAAVGLLENGTFSGADLARATALISRFETILTKQAEGFSAFYDHGAKLFYASYDTGSRTFQNHIDRLFNEFRSGVAFVIAKYSLPKDAWDNLTLTRRTYTDSKGNEVENFVPYDGGAFQMLWPLLHAPELDFPEMKQALFNFLYSQADFAVQAKLPGLLSASFIPNGDYSGKIGLEAASETSDALRQDVVSLYALASAYSIDPHFVLAWLKEIKAAFPALLGPYGLYDSITASGAIGKRYYAIDQASLVLGLSGQGAAGMKNYLEKRSLKTGFDSLYQGLKLNVEGTDQALPSSAFASAPKSYSTFTASPTSTDFLSFISSAQDPETGKIDFAYPFTASGAVHDASASWMESGNLQKTVNLVSYLQDPGHRGERDLFLRAPLMDVLDKPRETGTFYDPGQGSALTSQVLDKDRGGLVHEIRFNLVPGGGTVGYYAKFDSLDLQSADFLTLALKRDPASGFPEKIKLELKGTGESFILTDIPAVWTTYVLPLKKPIAALTEIAISTDDEVSANTTAKLFVDDLMAVRLKQDTRPDIFGVLGRSESQLKTFVDQNKTTAPVTPFVRDTILLREVSMDQEGKIVHAVEEARDGTVKYFDQGKAAKMVTPDGKTVFFTDGYASSAIGSKGAEATFAYSKDRTGQMIEMIFNEPAAKRFFTPDGVLTKLIHQGITAVLNNSQITTLRTRYETLSNVTFRTDGSIKDADIILEDSTITLVRNGVIYEVIKPNGTKIFYALQSSGEVFVSAIETAKFGRSEYIYTYDASGKVSRIDARYVKDGQTIVKNIVPFLVDENRMEEGLILLDSPIVNAFDIAGNIGSFWTPGRGWVYEYRTTDPERGNVFGVNFTYGKPYYWMGMYVKLPNLDISKYEFVNVTLKKDPATTEPLSISVELKGPGGITITLNDVPTTWTDYNVNIGERNGSLYELTLLINLSSDPNATGGKFYADNVSFFSMKKLYGTDWKGELSFTEDQVKAVEKKAADAPFIDPKTVQVAPPKPQYLKSTLDFPVTTHYDSTLKPIDFKRGDGAVAKVVNGQVSEITLTNGSKVTYSTSSSTSSDATSATYAYDKIRQVVTPEGNALSYSYEFDTDGIEITVVRDSKTEEVRRYKDGKLISVTDLTGLTTVYEYNGDEFKSSTLTYKGRSLGATQYQIGDKETAITDETGITWFYDKDGNLLAHRTPDGLLYLYKDVIDDQGKPVRTVFLAEKLAKDSTHFIYDEGQIREVQTSDGIGFTDLSFDDDRNLIGATVTYEDGTKVVYLNNLPISITSPTGSTKNLAAALDGEVSVETDKKGKFAFLVVKKQDRTLRYNREGQLVNITFADGHVYEYLYNIFSEHYTDNFGVFETVPKLLGGQPILFALTAEVRRNTTGVISQGMASVFVNDRLISEATQGLQIVALDDVTGSLFGSANFDLSKPGQTEVLKNYMDQIPNGKYVVAMYLDTETSYGDNPALLTQAFEEIGSVKVPNFQAADTKPWIVFGKKGLLKGQAIENFTNYTDAIRFDSVDKRMHYFNTNGQEITLSEAFAPVGFPNNLVRSARRSVRMEDVTQIFGTITPRGDSSQKSASSWFKNFNSNYPTSGFYNFWTDIEIVDFANGGDALLDRYLSGILDLTSNFQTKAVYFDDRYPYNWIWKWAAFRIKAYFAERGYEVLDADGLKRYMQDNGPHAAVIMAQDVFPDTVVSTTDTNPLVRQYLDNGGTVVWTRDVPFYYIGHANGTKEIWGNPNDRHGLKAALGIMPGLESNSGAFPEDIDMNKWPSFDPAMLSANRKVNLNLRETDAWVRLKGKFGAARPAADTEVVSVYDSENKLSQIHTEDGGFSIYDKGLLMSVYNAKGKEIMRYEYDEEGNPVKVTLLESREQMENQITGAKIEVAEMKARALLELAKQRNSFWIQIFEQAKQQRTAIHAQRSQLEGLRYQEVCQSVGFIFKKKKCRTIEVPGVADALNNLNSQEYQLNQYEAEGYASLDMEIRNAKTKIDQDEGKALSQIDEKRTELKQTILHQEIYPLILTYYRNIMGRDPSTDEIKNWVERSTPAKRLDIAALKSEFLNSSEYVSRSQFVSNVKLDVQNTLTRFVNGAQVDRAAIRDSLGLKDQDMVSLTSSNLEDILNWIKAKTLHFGQSAFFALRDLLSERGITVDARDLAVKTIMLDILTGVINAHTQGDLLISMSALNKVGSLYGMSTTGSQMTLAELKVMLSKSGNHKIIAHVKGSHYIVLTGFRDGKILYSEPNIGPNGESFAVSEQDFLQIWAGATAGQSGYVLTSDQIPQTAKVLDKLKMQAIRGAFFGLDDLVVAIVLILASATIHAITNSGNGLNFFQNFLDGAVFATIVTIATVGIGQVVSSFASSLAPLAQGITSTIKHTVQFLGKGFAAIGQGLKAIGEFLLPGISGIAQAIGSGLTNFFHFLEPVGKVIINGLTKIKDYLFTPAGKTITTETGKKVTLFTTEQVIAKNVVAMGASYALTKGLDKLGVNSTLAGLATAFLTGGILGGTAKGSQTLARSFINNGLQALALKGVSETALHFGVAPPVANLFAISASALTGAALDPSVTVSQTLKNLAPSLIKEAAFTGVQAIGAKIGLSPTLSSLIGFPISSTLSAFMNGLLNFGTNLSQVFQFVKTELFSTKTLGSLVGIGSELIAKAVDVNPLLISLGLRGLVGGVSGLTNSGDDSNAAARFLNGVTGALKDSLVNIVSLDSQHSTPQERAFYINHMIDFKTKKGAQDVFDFMEAYANQILGRDTVESIFQSGKNVSQYLKAKRQAGDYTVKDLNGQKVHEYKVGGNSFTLSEDESTLLARKFGNQYEAGQYGFDVQGNYVLKNGTQTFTNGNETLVLTVRNADIVTVDMTSTGGESVRFYGTQAEPLVLTHDTKSGFKIQSGVMKNWNSGETFLYQDGKLLASQNTQVINYAAAGGTPAAGIIQMVQHFSLEGIAFGYEIHMDQGLRQEFINGNQTAADSFWDQAIDHQPVPTPQSNIQAWLETINLKRQDLANNGDQAVDKLYNYVKPYYDQLKQTNPLLYNDQSLNLLRLTVKGFIDTIRIGDKVNDIFTEAGDLKANWKDLTLPQRTQKMLSIGGNVLTETFRGLNVLMIGGAIKSIGKAAIETAVNALEGLTEKEIAEQIGYFLRQNTNEATASLVKLFKNTATKTEFLEKGAAEDIVQAYKRALILDADLASVPFLPRNQIDNLVKLAGDQYVATGKLSTTLGGLSDTRALLGNEGLNILNLPDAEWTLAKNMEWLQQAVDRGDDILLVTNEIKDGTIYAQEYQYLLQRGYKRIGNHMVKLN